MPDCMYTFMYIVSANGHIKFAHMLHVNEDQSYIVDNDIHTKIPITRCIVLYGTVNAWYCKIKWLYRVLQFNTLT